MTERQDGRGVAPDDARRPTSPGWSSLPYGMAPYLGITVFAAALWILYGAFAALPWADVTQGLAAIGGGAVAWALVLTAVSFLLLATFDGLGLRYAERSLGAGRTLLGSFLGNAFSQAMGYPLFAAAPIRARLYAAWGLSAEDVLRVVGMCALTLWLGFLGAGSGIFLAAPGPVADAVGLPALVVRTLGALLGLGVVGALAWSWIGRSPVEVSGLEVSPPHTTLLVLQLALGTLHWLAAATVLFVLLPAGHGVAPVAFLGIFLVALMAGHVSHVPGGLGVTEAVLVMVLPDAAVDGELLASLMAWRATYHLFPLLGAVAVLGAWEIRGRAALVERTVGAVGRGVTSAAPVLLSAATFVAGGLLLFYGAIPARPSYLSWADGFLPYGLVEVSHFLASIAGAMLLVLAWGLAQRLDAAYLLALALIALGTILSLVRGGQLVPSLTLTVLLLAMLPARREFFRSTSLTAEPFSQGWVAMIGGVLLGTTWLGSLAYRNVDLSTDLWWQFTLTGDASRFVRGTTGAAAVLLVFGAVRLLRPSVPAALMEPPGSLPPDAVAAALNSERASAMLALTGDKGFLFSESRRSFVMYGVEGRSWVALGDPVGDPSETEEMVWAFRRLVHRYGGWPAFYQVRPARLDLYLDAGLSLIKLGEEAMIPLEGFTLEGARWKDLRKAVNRAERDGTTFELVPSADVAPLLPELREVSDAWLTAKSTREKGFSVGAFRETYLARTPVGVVRQDGRITGFVNVLAPDARQELSADLMRFRPDAFSGIMDFLFARILLWGRDAGYQRFSLGMAPLSGLEGGPLAPLWARLGAAVFRHGEHFYNFQGLRTFKEKFDPVWEPRYLACPGGFTVPRVLTHVGALVGGGLTGIVRR